MHLDTRIVVATPEAITLELVLAGLGSRFVARLIDSAIQIAIILATALLAAIPLGAFMARVYAGKRTFLSPVLGPVERGFYALAGVNPEREQSWRGYALAMLLFNAAGFALLYAILRLQGLLPFNPQGFDGLSPDLAFNTAVSFVTNTNWQS